MKYEKGKWYVARAGSTNYLIQYIENYNNLICSSNYINSRGRLVPGGAFHEIIREATLEEVASGEINTLNNIVPKTIIKTKNMDEGDLELEMMFQKSKTKTSPRVRIKESDIDRQQLSSRSGATSNKYDGVFPLKRDANRPLLFNSPEYNKLRRH